MRRCFGLIGLSGFLLLAACKSTPTQSSLRLSVFDGPCGPCEYHTKFHRAAYRLSPGGLVELVMRAERPSEVDPTQTVNQVIYVKSFWNPQPTRNFIDATQIDARVQYALLTLPTGVRYDGSAMLTWRYDKKTKKLAGWIESGNLSPHARLGDAVEPFGSANFTGTFVAEDNPGLVVDTAQILETRFNQPGSPPTR